MPEPKLTEAQRKELTNALWHHYNNGAELEPFVARMVAAAEQAARAEALRQAADAWQQGQWVDAPRRAERAQERIANAQFVTDWLRKRAEATP